MERLARLAPSLLMVACSGNPQVTATQQVVACEKAHGLTQARVVQPSVANVRRVFASCAWPPGPGAHPDGYAATTVKTLPGPGTNEATDATQVDQISGTCQSFRLTYRKAFMGSSSLLHATASAGTVTSQDTPGKPYTKNLGFRISPHDLYFVRSGVIGLIDAECGS